MSTFQTLLDSYGDLANRYAALEAENAAYEDERNADHGDAERRIHNLEHALEIAEEDNATLKARVIELEAERDELVVEASRFAADNNELRDDTDRLAVERDAWFSKYQVLKERTDNYEFLLYKVKEQEKEIYRLVKEINELGG